MKILTFIRFLTIFPHALVLFLPVLSAFGSNLVQRFEDDLGFHAIHPDGRQTKLLLGGVGPP